MSLSPETILALAQVQGVTVTPARAREIAPVIDATLAVVTKLPVAFEAEPAAFATALEEVSGQ